MNQYTCIALESVNYSSNGQTSAFKTDKFSYLAVDVNVSRLRGNTPTIAIFFERQGADGNWYPIWSPTALSASGSLSTTIGSGQATNQALTDLARVRWAFTGTNIATTVTTGANSATQVLGSTAGMVAGDVLHFATANADRTIQSVTDSTHVVLTQAINSTTTEAVTVKNTPDATLSLSVQSRA